jgi:hypothetical protein
MRLFDYAADASMMMMMMMDTAAVNNGGRARKLPAVQAGSEKVPSMVLTIVAAVS